MPLLCQVSVCSTLLILCAGGAPGQTASHKTHAAPPKVTARVAAAPVSYHEVVETAIKASCGSCHSADKHSGGLVIETPESLFKGGGTTGAKIIVPGSSSASLLIAFLRGTKQPRMPLNSPALPDATVKVIAAWIDQGAKVDAVKLGWPYTPPVAHTPPHVGNAAWPRNPIDNFVLAKLEARGLRPAPQAGTVSLMRRVYADLIGEPPTLQEQTDFLGDPSPKAYEKLVDRLLADPRYGERWGRHWLDLVRYAETHGFENDGVRPHAWRYRDYVIRAFNEDKPYDRFLKEQLAGDELVPGDSDAITATGYARLGPWDELSTDPAQRWQDYLNDVTDTTGSVMLGLTVGCARCHNHKYDRITQADYYRTQAFFVQTKWTEPRLPDTGSGSFRLRIAADQAKISATRKSLAVLLDPYRARAATAGKPHPNDGDLDKLFTREDRELRDRLQSQIREAESDKAPYDPVAEAISDSGRTAPAEHLLLRGNLLTPGPEVQPSYIASLFGGSEAPAPITPPATGNTTGRRSALANWIASATNPMTARVMVNRLWQHHFGVGIVATPSDFGRNGDKPTHPELLDWLAVRLMADGWSLKKMQRLMLLSATYQQSVNQPAPALYKVAAKADPTNKLLWHANRIRLEGEALRDTILATSGRLNPQMGGPSIYPHVSDEVLSTGSTHKWGGSPEDQQLRRTVYVFQRRSLVLPIVEAFDGPDTGNTCPRRAVTTIAPQALALFNGEFSRAESRHFAERVAQLAGPDTGRQIDEAYRIALCRLPTAAQKSLAAEFLTKQTQLHATGIPARNPSAHIVSTGDKPADGLQESQIVTLAELCHVLINTNEFIYPD